MTDHHNENCPICTKPIARDAHLAGQGYRIDKGGFRLHYSCFNGTSEGRALANSMDYPDRRMTPKEFGRFMASAKPAKPLDQIKLILTGTQPELEAMLGAVLRAE